MTWQPWRRRQLRAVTAVVLAATFPASCSSDPRSAPVNDTVTGATAVTTPVSFPPSTVPRVSTATTPPPTTTTTTAPPTTTTTTTTTPPPTTTAPPNTTTTSAPATTAPPADTSCIDEADDGAGSFDLLSAAATRFDGSYQFVANYLGPARGRVVLIAFVIGSFDYQVGGKQFDDGTSAAFVYDFHANTQQALDDAVVTDGYVMLPVSDDLIESVAGGPLPFTVTLNVDGTDIDGCTTI